MSSNNVSIIIQIIDIGWRNGQLSCALKYYDFPDESKSYILKSLSSPSCALYHFRLLHEQLDFTLLCSACITKKKKDVYSSA